MWVQERRQCLMAEKTGMENHLIIIKQNEHFYEHWHKTKENLMTAFSPSRLLPRLSHFYSMQTRLADSVENAQQLSLTIASSSSFLVLLSDGPSWIQLELQCCMEMPVTTNYQASSTYFVPLWGHREKGRGREPSRLMASKLLLHHCKACNFLLKKEMHYL